MTSPVIAITGAFGILGAATATMAQAQGWRLALIDHAPRPRHPLGVSEGEDVLFLGGFDLGEAGEAARAVAAVTARFGRLDALLNIAGGFRWMTLADSDPAVWDMLFRTNVQTAANMSRAALGPLQASGRGRIVNVGANAAERAGAGMAPIRPPSPACTG